MSACLKYRADLSVVNNDGSHSFFAVWIGGPTLSKIEKCRWIIEGNMQVTVFVTGEPDTLFSIPAAINHRGCVIRGFLSQNEDGNLVFHHTYF